MGAQVSSTSQKFQSELSNKIDASCPKTECKNEMDLGVISATGKGSKVSATQRCKAAATCVMQHALDLASQQAFAAEATAKGGLGLAATDSRQDVRTKIENQIRQRCEGTSSTNKLLAKSARARSGAIIELVQEGDATTQCQLGGLSALVQQLEAKSSSTAAGFDPTAIIIVVAIVALIGGVAFLVFKDKLGF